MKMQNVRPTFGHNVMSDVMLDGEDTGRWLDGTRKLGEDSLGFRSGLSREDSWAG